MNEDIKKVQNALIIFYMMVKIRKGSEVYHLIIKRKQPSQEEKIEEANDLKKQNLLTLIEFIKSSFDIAVSIKLEKELKKYKSPLDEDNENAAEKYETLLRKEESNIRQHISVN